MDTHNFDDLVSTPFPILPFNLWQDTESGPRGFHPRGHGPSLSSFVREYHCNRDTDETLGGGVHSNRVCRFPRTGRPLGGKVVKRPTSRLVPRRLLFETLTHSFTSLWTHRRHPFGRRVNGQIIPKLSYTIWSFFHLLRRPKDLRSTDEHVSNWESPERDRDVGRILLTYFREVSLSVNLCKPSPSVSTLHPLRRRFVVETRSSIPLLFVGSSHYSFTSFSPFPAPYLPVSPVFLPGRVKSSTFNTSSQRRQVFSGRG